MPSSACGSAAASSPSAPPRPPLASCSTSPGWIASSPSPGSERALRVVAVDHLGHARGLLLPVHLEGDVVGHLGAAGDVLDLGQGGPGSQLGADRHGGG